MPAATRWSRAPERSWTKSSSRWPTTSRATPEVGHKEERSVKILTDYLRAHDFDVETGVAGLKTAFVGRYKKGTPGPKLGVILEDDGLLGTTRDFHGDQHSAQGPLCMAARRAD